MQYSSFQALHSPLGANATFALGLPGSGGGFGLEQDRVPAQDVFIGIVQGGKIRCFPYYAQAVSRASESFEKTASMAREGAVLCYEGRNVHRTYGYGSDTFSAENLTFSISVPVRGIPDPNAAPASAVEEAVCPALTARLSVDNQGNAEPLQAFFAVSPMRGKIRLSEQTGGELKGIGSRDGYGFAVRNCGDGIQEAMDFDLPTLFGRRAPVVLTIAPLGALLFEIPADTCMDFDLVLGWYRNGLATDGDLRCRYYYTRYFPDLSAVLRYGLDHGDAWRKLAADSDDRLQQSDLSEHQRFLVTHSTRAYAASTMLLDHGGEPLWVVNEGSYMMMGTFDLAVDHCFFELKQNPWVVKNQLELYASRYFYTDQCGLTFCHDFGTHNVFMTQGKSSYEIPDRNGCYSYMSQEQLCNWIVTAAMYMHRTRDEAWLSARLPTIKACLESMAARTGGREDGIMHVDSSRCGGGREITTYDSLDSSLGQSRENLYIAVKCFASYLCLEMLLREYAPEEADRAHAYAVRCGHTVAAAFQEELGYIPAVLDGQNQSAIIPAIEPLIYLEQSGLNKALDENGEFGALIQKLKRHLNSILVKGVCLFEDGGFKLSSNNDNSWMSKIFLCQYVARTLLHVIIPEEADAAHVRWWAVNTASCPAIDQIIAGYSAEIGFHYPRSVTTALWW